MNYVKQSKCPSSSWHFAVINQYLRALHFYKLQLSQATVGPTVTPNMTLQTLIRPIVTLTRHSSRPVSREVPSIVTDILIFLLPCQDFSSTSKLNCPPFLSSRAAINKFLN